MISYKNFWRTLKKKKISQYRLNVYYGISNSQINRMKNDEHITTATLEKLCDILNCKIEDIITFIPSKSCSKAIHKAVAEKSSYK